MRLLRVDLQRNCRAMGIGGHIGWLMHMHSPRASVQINDIFDIFTAIEAVGHPAVEVALARVGQAQILGSQH